MNNKIKKLTANNIKIIKAVEIEPKKNLILIAGENGHGKTTLLDCIEWAIAGTKSIDERPVREGEEKGEIKLELDDLVIIRKFTQKIGEKYKTTLKVRNKEGSSYESPQKILDKLVGGLNFDPLKFSNMKPKEQFEELRKVLNIDFDFEEHERRKESIYDERTYINRDIKQLEGEIAGIQYSVDTPNEEINVRELSDKLTEYLEINKKDDNLSFNISQVKKRVDELEEKKYELQGKIHLINIEIQKEIENEKSLIQEVESFETIPNEKINKIQEEINNSSEINKNVSYKNLKKQKKKELQRNKNISQNHTNELKSLDDIKAKEISKVEMPIEGLELGDYKISHNGTPFAQLNSAKKLEISCAIVMNSDNELKVIRIENGSLLDDKNLDIIKKMAKKYKYQVWIEKVDSSGEVGIVFEHGEIKKIN